MGKSFKFGLTMITVSLLIVTFFWLKSCIKKDYVEIGTDGSIGMTPTQIQSIKAIGEWEFLSINMEELADTVRKGILSDDELVRIYDGTLHLGINMHQVEPGWLQTVGDSVSLTLPEIGLLDRDFIDEARSRAFFESGSWKPEDRDALYRQAREKMLRHGLTQENLKIAEDNAREQLSNLMKTMGYKKINIVFRK